MRNKILILGLLLGHGGCGGRGPTSNGLRAPATPWLFPGLLEHLPSVTGLRLSGAGDGVDLVFDEGAWVVAQRFNYPANDKQLFQLLNQLGEARLIEKKTALSKHHASVRAA